MGAEYPIILDQRTRFDLVFQLSSGSVPLNLTGHQVAAHIRPTYDAPSVVAMRPSGSLGSNGTVSLYLLPEDIAKLTAQKTYIYDVLTYVNVNDAVKWLYGSVTVKPTSTKL